MGFLKVSKSAIPTNITFLIIISILISIMLVRALSMLARPICWDSR